MSRWEMAALWAVCYFGALVAFAARVTYRLAGDPVPPADPALMKAWLGRRRWLMISEFSALPFFSTVAVAGAEMGWASPVGAVIFALVTGALGFAFFLHALEAILRQRWNLPGGPAA